MTNIHIAEAVALFLLVYPVVRYALDLFGVLPWGRTRR